MAEVSEEQTEWLYENVAKLLVQYKEKFDVGPSAPAHVLTVLGNIMTNLLEFPSLMMVFNTVMELQIKNEILKTGGLDS